MSDEEDKKPAPKKRGRPTKAAVAARKRGSTGKSVGRPKGDAAIINEYKARMLASPKSAKVMEAIMTAALNDEHPHQAAAWRLVMERIAPVAAFTQDIDKSNGKNALSITIQTVGEVTATKDVSPIEASFTEIGKDEK